MRLGIEITGKHLFKFYYKKCQSRRMGPFILRFVRTAKCFNLVDSLNVT